MADKDFAAKKFLKLAYSKVVTSVAFIKASLIIVGVFLYSPSFGQEVDLLVKNCLVYDGSGGQPFKGIVVVNADTIVYVGREKNVKAVRTLDAGGKAIAPGFINMLSWADVSLIKDGRSLSDIKQGVTLEVFGEGRSMGPITDHQARRIEDLNRDFGLHVSWRTLGEYLHFLEQKGVACNVASFVGATSVREYVIGEDNRTPTPLELDSMKLLVDEAMGEGALGLGSSLIYPPAFFAGTDELIALAKVVGKYGGSYISHMRSEGNRLLLAIRELIAISKAADIHGEIYHLKAAGIANWPKMDSAINLIDSARSRGIDIGANMYLYEAGATGLTASFPPYLQDGGFDKLWNRLQDSTWRGKMKVAMLSNPVDWENLYSASGSADKVLLLNFRQDSLKKYSGKTLKEVADIRGTDVPETAMDLIVADSSRIGTAYFLMSDENIQKEIALPYISFGSDASSMSTDTIFTRSGTHPRAFGNVARLLGKYVRDENIITLPEAIYKLTQLSAEKLHIKRRGELRRGYFADLVIFDPALIKDKATYGAPYQYAEGVTDVFVNGKQVLQQGEPTGLLPGIFVKGPGYKENR